MANLNIESLTVHDQNTKIWTQDSLRVGKVVLYFYPKDNTPGCTNEAKDFAHLYAEFVAAGWEVVGVSKDTVASHQKFSEKFSLPFPLLADINGQLCEGLQVFKQKSMFGKSYMGVERSTFLIAEGSIVHEWRKVKVTGHAQVVLNQARSIFDLQEE